MKQAIALTLVAMVLAAASIVHLQAQEKPPAFTADEKLAIVRAQSESQAVQLQMKQLEIQYRDLQSSAAEKQKAFTEVIVKTFEAHKLKLGEWELDKDLNLKKVEPKK